MIAGSQRPPCCRCSSRDHAGISRNCACGRIEFRRSWRCATGLLCSKLLESFQLVGEFHVGGGQAVCHFCGIVGGGREGLMAASGLTSSVGDYAERREDGTGTSRRINKNASLRSSRSATRLDRQGTSTSRGPTRICSRIVRHARRPPVWPPSLPAERV